MIATPFIVEVCKCHTCGFGWCSVIGPTAADHANQCPVCESAAEVQATHERDTEAEAMWLAIDLLPPRPSGGLADALNPPKLNCQLN